MDLLLDDCIDFSQLSEFKTDFTDLLDIPLLDYLSIDKEQTTGNDQLLFRTDVTEEKSTNSSESRKRKCSTLSDSVPFELFDNKTGECIFIKDRTERLAQETEIKDGKYGDNLNAISEELIDCLNNIEQSNNDFLKSNRAISIPNNETATTISGSSLFSSQFKNHASNAFDFFTRNNEIPSNTHISLKNNIIKDVKLSSSCRTKPSRIKLNVKNATSSSHANKQSSDVFDLLLHSNDNDKTSNNTLEYKSVYKRNNFASPVDPQQQFLHTDNILQDVKLMLDHRASKRCCIGQQFHHVDVSNINNAITNKTTNSGSNDIVHIDVPSVQNTEQIDDVPLKPYLINKKLTQKRYRNTNTTVLTNNTALVNNMNNYHCSHLSILDKNKNESYNSGTNGKESKRKCKHTAANFSARRTKVTTVESNNTSYDEKPVIFKKRINASKTTIPTRLISKSVVHKNATTVARSKCQSNIVLVGNQQSNSKIKLRAITSPMNLPPSNSPNSMQTTNSLLNEFDTSCEYDEHSVPMPNINYNVNNVFPHLLDHDYCLARVNCSQNIVPQHYDAQKSGVKQKIHTERDDFNAMILIDDIPEITIDDFGNIQNVNTCSAAAIQNDFSIHQETVNVKPNCGKEAVGSKFSLCNDNKFDNKVYNSRDDKCSSVKDSAPSGSSVFSILPQSKKSPYSSFLDDNSQFSEASDQSSSSGVFSCISSSSVLSRNISPTSDMYKKGLKTSEIVTMEGLQSINKSAVKKDNSHSCSDISSNDEYTSNGESDRHKRLSGNCYRSSSSSVSPDRKHNYPSFSDQKFHKKKYKRSRRNSKFQCEKSYSESVDVLKMKNSTKSKVQHYLENGVQHVAAHSESLQHGAPQSELLQHVAPHSESSEWGGSSYCDTEYIYPYYILPYCSSQVFENGKQPKKEKFLPKERRVLYVNGIEEGLTKDEFRRRFEKFGIVQNISLHFRENGENYGFVTYLHMEDVFIAMRHGNDEPNLRKYSYGIGGRREFCGKKYIDLDAAASSNEFHKQQFGSSSSAPVPHKRNDSFEALLKQFQQDLTRRKCS